MTLFKKIFLCGFGLIFIASNTVQPMKRGCFSCCSSRKSVTENSMAGDSDDEIPDSPVAGGDVGMDTSVQEVFSGTVEPETNLGLTIGGALGAGAGVGVAAGVSAGAGT